MRGRRGPGLIGTAVVVGGAAHMGAKSAQKSQAAAQQEADQNAQIAELQAQQTAAVPVAAPAPAAAPAAPVSSGPTPEDLAAIEKLAAMKESGVLTEEEFAAQKAKILGA